MEYIQEWDLILSIFFGVENDVFIERLPGSITGFDYIHGFFFFAGICSNCLLIFHC